MHLNTSKSLAIQRGARPWVPDEVDFKLATKKILHFNKYRPDDVVYNALNIPYGLTSPCAVFQGLQREEHELSLCYVSRPKQRFIGENISVSLGQGWVFLVFVNSSLEIFDWRFEKADELDSRFPKGYSNRFDKKLWPL